MTNMGIKAQTDGQTAGTGILKEKVGSAQGRRVQGTYQESRRTRMAGGRARHKKATTARRSLMLGMIPERQRCQGWEQSAPFLHRFCLPTSARAASSFPFPGRQHIHVPGHRIQGHVKAPNTSPQCRYFLHHLCPSVMSPWLHLKPFQGRDPRVAAYTNLVNATHFCPGYQSKMSLQCSTFIKVLMELESSHQKARWLVFLCY